jgi:DNA-binding transcriptional regulator YiaG
MTSNLSRQAAQQRAGYPQRSYRIRDRKFLQLKRESRHLSQANLAAFIGVSRSAVTHWESGTNTGIAPAHAELIAIILDEPLHTLCVME